MQCTFYLTYFITRCCLFVNDYFSLQTDQVAWKFVCENRSKVNSNLILAQHDDLPSSLGDFYDEILFLSSVLTVNICDCYLNTVTVVDILLDSFQVENVI